MSGKPKELIIVLVSNYWEGYFQSLAWFVALVGAIGLAVWIESTAMQWVMALIWLLALIGWAIGETARKRLTPDEAIAEIESLKRRSQIEERALARDEGEAGNAEASLTHNNEAQ